MNVLNFISLRYYIQLHLFCIMLLLAVFLGYYRGNWRKKADPNGRIGAMILHNIISFVLLIAITTFRSLGGNAHIALGYITANLWIGSVFGSNFFWCLFVEETHSMMLNRDSRRKYLWIIPCAIVMLITVTTPFTHLAFTLEPDGQYEYGPLFLWIVAFYNIFYALIAARSVIISLRSFYEDKKRMFRIFAVVPVVLTICSYFREYELSCTLHTLAVVSLYVFLSRDSENKQNENILGLADEFEAVFLIDVDKDSIYSVAINDTNILSATIGNGYWKGSYKETVRAIIDKYLLDEERAETNKDMEAEHVYRLLLDTNNYTRTYQIKTDSGNIRYYSLRFVRSTAKKQRRFILGIKNIDDITRSRMRRDEILKGIAADYDSVLYIDTVRMTPEERYILNPELEQVMPYWDNLKDFEDKFREFVSTHVAAEDRERFKRENNGDYIFEQLQKKNAYTCNFKMVADGKIMYYQLKYIAKKQDDKIVGIVLGFRNVDEERRTELAVEVENGIRSDILSVLTYEYSILFFGNMRNTNYNVIYVSDKMFTDGKTEVTSIKSMREAYEKYIMSRIHPDDHELVLETLTPEQIKKQLADKKRTSTVIRCKVGKEYKYHELVVAKAEAIQEEPINIAMGIAEIDSEYREKLAQEDRLREALVVADAANNAKSTFLFNMSHDIRTPLNAIKGFTELASQNVDDAKKVSEYLKKIDLSGDHLVKLVNEILDMARIESGKITAESVPTTMNDIAEKVMNICRESAAQKNISLTLRKYSAGRMILADELHVTQILMNIIGNAIKYTPEGGTVAFKISEISGAGAGQAKYRLMVEDTGMGMSSEYLEHIFEYFSQERNPGMTGIEGAGLGMAIVKRLVDFMGGTIKITSEPGVGTKVVVELCFPVQTIHTLNGAESPNVELSLAGKRVLIVEDNEMNREIVTEIMKAYDLIPDDACDGSKAVEAIKNKGADYYDYILMDIQMPVMDGYEAAGQIRKLQDGDKIAIIALSANAFEEDKKKSLEAGMNAHVAKPINVAELLRVMREYI